AVGNTSLTPLLAAVAATPDDVDALYAAGYQAYEEGLYDVAAALLLRANQRSPGNVGIVCEAAGALEQLLRYREAADVLAASGLVATDPFCAYLHGFSCLMCGERDAARDALKALATVDDPQLVDLRHRLEAMLARADLLAAAGQLSSTSLTAWHLALNGTLLLHESPHGHSEPMHGRYAFVQDSAALMHHGIERLAFALDEQIPPHIVHAPDRASRILGLAIAQRFNRPLMPWSTSLGSPQDCLVVVWSLEHVDDPGFLRALSRHAPGQVLFAHASSWTAPNAWAPDVTTLLYQSITNPWTGGALQLTSTKHDTSAALPAPIDIRADDVLASEITAVGAMGAVDDSVSGIGDVIAIRDVVKPLRGFTAAGLFRDGGGRSMQRIGSVVPSARFT
ncbi:MAG TPA: hypothetical protein VGF99_16080, partial [Myxococcota bacterium]